MAKLPDKMQYGIVAINGLRLPTWLQIPFIVLHMKVQSSDTWRLNEARDAVDVGFRVRTEQRKTAQAFALLLGRIYGFITDLCGIEHTVDLKIGQIEKPKDTWIIKNDRLAVRIGGSELFGFQLTTKKHQVTFFGYEGWNKKTQDHICLGNSGGVFLLGFLLSWTTYGKRKKGTSGNLCFYRHGWKWTRQRW